ncbi:MAG: hypothetical protein FWG87_05940 [Defluviitaleaceae bacterium]|nr:hypothetical protein [Defluviitaleaceae bacterium]
MKRGFMRIFKGIKHGFNGFTQIYADFIGRIGFSWISSDFPTNESA